MEDNAFQGLQGLINEIEDYIQLWEEHGKDKEDPETFAEMKIMLTKAKERQEILSKGLQAIRRSLPYTE